MKKYLLICWMSYEGAEFYSFESDEPKEKLWERFKNTVNPKTDNIQDYEIVTLDEFWTNTQRINSVTFTVTFKDIALKDSPAL